MATVKNAPKSAAKPAATPAEAPAAPKVDLTEKVKLRLQEGTKEHGTLLADGSPRWLINPTFNGRERWFDRTKIAGSGMDKKGYFVEVTRKEAIQRGMQAFIEA